MNSEERQYLDDETTVSEFPTLPAGTYEAILDGVTSEEHDLYGLRWVWHWIIPEMHPDGGDFSLLYYSMLGFPKLDGLRIYHLFSTPSMARRCTTARVDRDERKGKKPSDHAPVIAEFESLFLRHRDLPEADPKRKTPPDRRRPNGQGQN